MASFLVVSQRGMLAPLVARMEAEGADVGFYVHEDRFRAVYEGGMTKRPLSPARLRRLLADLPPRTVAILDGASADVLTSDERELLGMPPAAEGELDTGFYGRLAQRLVAAGAVVYGSSADAERLSMSLPEGLSLARELGLETVPFVMPASPDEARLYLRSRSDPQVLRADHVVQGLLGIQTSATYAEDRPGDLLRRIDAGMHPELEVEGGGACLLSPRLAGTPYREEAWWDGATFRHHNCSFELGGLWPGDRGPVVESAATLTWFLRSPLVPWDRLATIVAGWDGYRGPVSVRFVVPEQGPPVAVRVVARPVFDALYGFVSLLWAPLSRFFAEDLAGGFQVSELAATIRVSVPPYPFASPRGTARPFEAGAFAGASSVSDLPRDLWAVDLAQDLRGVQLAGTSGLVGAAVGVDSDARSALRRAVQTADRLLIAAHTVYRTDTEALEEGWSRLRAIMLAS